ncbi:ATP-binding protein [Peptoniphilus catoniae]|uniref:ATP-binding protein n=1 Tax=Peptoniphilus catoniae TaxID=1660341 RepID=UPI0010FDCE54|nr:ATP-binding protein [Peptoniphilus catoniae]
MNLSNLNIYLITLFFIFSIIILVISIKFIVEVADNKFHSYFFIISVLIFFLSFLPFQVLAEIGSKKIFISALFLDMPLHLLIIYDIFIFALEIIFIKSFFKIENKNIGKNSIKESMDSLPDGICFSKLDGTPLLINSKMQEISYEVFGKMLVNDVACAEAVKNNKIKENAKILQRDPLVIESIGDIWQIKVINHKNVRETLAYNITLEWAMYQAIERKNKQIQKINTNLKDYQKNVGEYTRQKEILKAKIKIHDKIGQSLIYFKRYLEKTNKTKEDRDNLIKLWMESLLILDENNDSPKDRSLLEKLIAAANDIGVQVYVEGKLPKNKVDWVLLVDIVHEALNNAIRHGHAKNIWISLREDGIKNYCRIKNDSLTPKGPIIEKGGLKNIRQRLEPFNGTIKVSMNQNFQLDLSWLKGENYDL